MNLNFLIDQNISRKTTKFLLDFGLKVSDVRDLGLDGKSDEEIYYYARNGGFVIITFDHEFAYSFMNRKDLVGLIILRIHPQTLEIVHNILKTFFEKIKENEIKGSIVIVERHRFRIKRINKT